MQIDVDYQNNRQPNDKNEMQANQFAEHPFKPWILEGEDWVGRAAQEAYLAGGVYTFIILCLISMFVCMVYGCQKMIRARRAEIKHSKKSQEVNGGDFPTDMSAAKRYSGDRDEKGNESPVLQKGMKYMPQIDVSSESLGHEITSSQTFFFGQK
ncbi:hypothetical protein HELRODRAFT_161066 [Helobdella robusta]|uniref:Uncharacterized protein n=1 Tax=Helobdella robusta TaxID=6412 RepID=T1ER26_HELRO|nr:hypothetical protein HELRODRAFT_161066 [Helobdella robusta]ESO01878.1 hypothetical protein HELRODRAFT_161066 [Helobdella robusta]